jgi:uncharacterized protein (DUF2141 family)
MKLRLLCLTLTILFTGAVQAEEYSLAIHVNGVKNNQGMIIVELYNDPKTFRKSSQALAVQKMPAQAGIVTANFNGLSLGHYAILAYHDEDGNGQLNKRFGMIPTEGYALSNDPSVMGPPSFEDSDFEVLGDGELRLNMHY